MVYDFQMLLGPVSTLTRAELLTFDAAVRSRLNGPPPPQPTSPPSDMPEPGPPLSSEVPPEGIAAIEAILERDDRARGSRSQSMPCGAVRPAASGSAWSAKRCASCRMQKSAIRLTRRSAILSFDSSAMQPDLRIFRHTSIFQRIACQSSFSIASARERTGKSVIS